MEHLKQHNHREYKEGMNCCQNNSSSDSEHQEEEKKRSWKTVIVVILILGLLIGSSISLMIH